MHSLVTNKKGQKTWDIVIITYFNGRLNKTLIGKLTYRNCTAGLKTK